MAIDTAAERLQILDYEDVLAAGLPVPDGAIGTDDRMHLIWLYAPEAIIYVVTPGCATSTSMQLHLAAMVDALLYDAASSDVPLHTGLTEELTCDLEFAPTIGTVEAWTTDGQLKTLFEAATGSAADDTIGCYAMAAIGSTIYIGLGNWPGSTNGAVVMSSVDGKTFVTEKVLDEQGVLDMSVHGGVLWVPGVDPTDDWTFGNIYRLSSGVWTKLRTLTNVIHTLGLWHDGTHLHVATGAHIGNFLTWTGQTFRSADNGATWDSPVTISNYRVYDIIGWQARLYAVTYLLDASRQVQYSADDGVTWSVISGASPVQNPRMTIWGDYLLIVTDTGSLYTVDTSYTLAELTPDFTIYTSGFSPLAVDDVGYLYVLATDGGIYRTLDLATWDLFATVTGAIGLHFATNGYIYIPAHGQILRVLTA